MAPPPHTRADAEHPMPECRILRSTSLFVLSLVLLAAQPATSASAQIADAWLHYTPTELYAGWGSTRLMGMGEMQVSVVDDRSLIDIYNYSKNPAGIVAARDTSVLEFPFSYQSFNDSYYEQANSAYQRGGGIHGEVRPNRVWAVGFDVNYGAISSSRHIECPWPDNCRFLRDFDLPIAPSLTPDTTDQTFGAGVSSPLVTLTYGRVFKKRLSAGLTGAWKQENENRRFLSAYDMDMTSSALGIQGGAGYNLPMLGDAVTLAGFAGFMQNNVQTISQSPFNQDEYNWDRPQVSYGGELQVKKGAWLEGLADGRHTSYDADETATVNWAPQFYLNPFPADNQRYNVFKRKWTAFESGYRHNEFSTRWMVNVPNKPVHVGVGYNYYQEYEWIFPDSTVLPTISEMNVKRLGYRFAGGVSFDLADGKGVVAAETHIYHNSRQDMTYTLPDISMMTYTYNFGVEYLVRPWLPFRAGFVTTRHDPDRSDGTPPTKGNGITLGATYFWKGIGSRIDASYGGDHFSYSPDDPSSEVGAGDQFTLYIQRLF
jgi:hypothetical protein